MMDKVVSKEVDLLDIECEMVQLKESGNEKNRTDDCDTPLNYKK